MTIESTVHIWLEEGQYVAHAMPIDVMSSGPTPEAAREALAEAMRVFVETAQGEGTLAEILEECGYRMVEGCWVCPQWVATERQAVAV